MSNHLVTIDEIIQWHRSQADHYRPRVEPRMSGEVLVYPQSDVHRRLEQWHRQAANEIQILDETLKSLTHQG